MPTYFVSLSVSRPAGLDDEALIRLFRGAAERAACVPIEVTRAGLVIEAEAASLGTLEETLREAMQSIGGRVDRFSVTRF
jgi:hypothetical protein